MPITGSAPNKTCSRTDGTRNGAAVWQDSQTAGIGVVALNQDTHDQDLVTMLNTMLMRDGGNQATAALQIGGFKLENVAAGTTSTDGGRIGQLIPASTVSLFQQTAAPTGWTKLTSQNDKALRVVSGTAGTGGSTAFSTVFASRTPAGTVGETALTIAQMPAHDHGGATNTTGAHTHTWEYQLVSKDNGPFNQCPNPGGTGDLETTSSAGNHSHTISSQGSGDTHTHTFTGTALDFAVAYVDVILASKDAYA